MNRMYEEKLTELEQEATLRADYLYNDELTNTTLEHFDVMSVNDAIDDILQIVEEFNPEDQNKIIKSSITRLKYLREKMIDELKQSNDTI